METFPDDDFSQMSFPARLGYLHGLLLPFKSEVIEILNDPNEPNNAKFFYCFVMVDGIARTFKCIEELFSMLQLFALSDADRIFPG